MDLTKLNDQQRVTLTSVTPDNLVERAVRNALPRRSRGWTPRWVAVMDAFGCGSTMAMALCRAYGLEPEQIRVSRRFAVETKPGRP